MRIAVTGAGGFVGRHLVPAAAQAGHEVIPVYSPRDARGPGVDLESAAAVDAAVARARPEAVVHLAARRTPGGLAGLQALLDSNVRCAGNVLDAVMRHAPAARVVVVSSSAVYGMVPRERNPVEETEPLRPVLPYGTAKVEVEAIAGVYAGRGLDVVIARPFNHIGPGQQANFAAASFARQIALIQEGAAGPVIETGPLDRVRDLIDVRDVVRAYLLLLAGKPGPGPFNVCSGTPRTMEDVLREMLALTGLTAEIRRRTGQSSETDIPYQCGSYAALRSAVGWEPQVAWSQTLRDLLEDWRARVREAGAA